MILTGQNRITPTEICPSATLSTTYLTWTEVGTNVCLLDDRPATKRLRRGTDFRCTKVPHKQQILSPFRRPII
jgi:hypothetical protein